MGNNNRKGTRMQGLHEEIGFNLLLIAKRFYLGYLWCIGNERQGPERPNFTYNK